MRGGNRKLLAGCILLTNQPKDWNEAAVPRFIAPSYAWEVKDHLSSLKDKGPAEIKLGCTKRSRSLNNYMDEYHPERVIRFSERNFGLSNGIESVPLYAVWCLWHCSVAESNRETDIFTN